MKQLRYAPLLPRLIAAIGVDATLKLVSAHGGQTMHVPRYGERSQILIDAIGEEAAIQFASAFADYQRISVPMPDKLLAKIRNQQIQQWIIQGRTRKSVARDLNLTERRVKQLVADLRAEAEQLDPQGSLF